MGKADTLCQCATKLYWASRLYKGVLPGYTGTAKTICWCASRLYEEAETIWQCATKSYWASRKAGTIWWFAIRRSTLPRLSVLLTITTSGLPPTTIQKRSITTRNTHPYLSQVSLLSPQVVCHQPTIFFYCHHCSTHPSLLCITSALCAESEVRILSTLYCSVLVLSNNLLLSTN